MKNKEYTMEEISNELIVKTILHHAPRIFSKKKTVTYLIPAKNRIILARNKTISEVLPLELPLIDKNNQITEIMVPVEIINQSYSCDPNAVSRTQYEPPSYG